MTRPHIRLFAASALLASLPFVPAEATEEASAESLLEMRDESSSGRWEVIDDRKMLGKSHSYFLLTDDGTGVFAGEVKPSIAGGWCSVRRTFEAPSDLSDASTVTLRVRGDGRTYGIDLRDDRSLRGVYHEAVFETRPGEWMDLEVPISAFEPLSMGSPTKDPDGLDRSKIWSVAFVIARGQKGNFRLEVERIGYRRATPDPEAT